MQWPRLSWIMLQNTNYHHKSETQIGITDPKTFSKEMFFFLPAKMPPTYTTFSGLKTLFEDKNVSWLLKSRNYSENVSAYFLSLMDMLDIRVINAYLISLQIFVTDFNVYGTFPSECILGALS